MAALADLDDAARLGYTLDPDRGPALLERASVRVRRYTKQTITRVTNDVVYLPVHASRVRLPQIPADKPTLVEIDTGIYQNLHTSWYWNLSTSTIQNLGSLWEVRVTYSHGYTVVPDEIKDIVCAIAARLEASGGASQSGLQSESAGGVSVSYFPTASEGRSGLSSEEEGALDRIFGKPRPTTLEAR